MGVDSRAKRKVEYFFSSMAVRLWLIMMLLVAFTVGTMWIFQIIVMERNYTNMEMRETEERLEVLMEELSASDLAQDENLIADLNSAVNGKLMLVNEEGKLMGMYSYGHPIDLENDPVEISVWNDIENSDVYLSILEREPYTREIRDGSWLVSYEIGFPVLYGGQSAYVILYRSFTELYQVLNMNRLQLIGLSILLTLVSSIIAVLLSKRFTKPIYTIKTAVDEMAAGDLTAVPRLERKDEIGQLADSVCELGSALQRVEGLRREVIANVSHELRSSLALIGGYAEMVRDVHWSDDQKRAEDLNLIIRESRRMSEMVSDILDYSQIQAGYMKLHRDFYDLYEIIESTVRPYESHATEQQISIQFQTSQTEYMVRVDAIKISQVIRNLLYNAVNHTENGGKIEVTLESDEKEYIVSVRNTGEPIPEEERKLIWERYQRSQHQGGRKEGTGIGLSIVSTILEAHGMSYGVDCTDTENIFWFRCPKSNE
ncbi:MAG: HAMP domain-containing histidine kinase [Clostridiales bacterium]|nr:HAMP domain-containing histidine kinase [Clostridiales bacterium]